MTKRSPARFVITLGAFALSVAWAILTSQLKASSGSSGVNLKTFPTIITGIMIVCSGIVCVKDFLEARRSESSALSVKDIARVVALILLMAAYTLCLEALGFVISTAVLMVAAMFIYGNKNKLVIFAVSILLPVALKLLFQYGLKILLP